MKLSNLYVKRVQSSLFFCACMLWPFRVVFTLGEPVESAPAAENGNLEPSHVVYDQRQTGKYNIHLSIKDVAIIEMDQNEIEDLNYNEDDYYYDEGHLTVKPIPLSPISSSNKLNQTVASTESATTITTTPSQQQFVLTNPSTPIMLVNQTSFSPNLLADIAATHAVNDEHIKMNATTTAPAAALKRTQSVVILDLVSTTHNSPTSTHKPATGTTLRPAQSSARSKDTSTKSDIEEQLLHPRQHLGSASLPPRPYFRFIDTSPANTDESNKNSEHEHDSRIFKFKVRRAHRGGGSGIVSSGHVPYPNPVTMRRTCRSNQFRDINGNCRTKRSTSLLKKLFSMLMTLPFAKEHAIGDQEDE